MKQAIILGILIAILFMMYRIYTISNEGWRGVTNTIQTKYIVLEITIPLATQPSMSKTIKTDISKFLAQVVPLQTNLEYYPNVSYITNIHTKSIKELVKKQALLAKKCGCHGIVCAGSDLKFVKKIFKREIITPGIRLKGDSIGDQKRVVGPKEAFNNGATSIVMGRSIIKGNIKNNINRLIKSLI